MSLLLEVDGRKTGKVHLGAKGVMGSIEGECNPLINSVRRTGT